MSRSSRRRVRGLAVGAVAAALTAGCGAQDGPGAERVAVADVQEPQYFYEGEYLGERVTVVATVTDVLGPEAFELAGADYGEDSLLVLTALPAAVSPGQTVRVTGTVGQYHHVSEHDHPPSQDDLYEKYETEAYLHGATVEPRPA